MIDLTKARGAVYALQNEDVKASPVLTVDYVIRAYTVTHATLVCEQVDGFRAMTGESIAETVKGKIMGAHHTVNRGTKQGATSRYAVY